MKLYLFEGQPGERHERVYVAAADLKTALNAIDFEPTRTSVEADETGDQHMRARLVVVAAK